ncbi:hypothetical protein B0H11DRAFT_1984300, partial [Mycena galericulata]
MSSRPRPSMSSRPNVPHAQDTCRPSILVLQLKWLSSAMGCVQDIKSQADEPVLPMASRQALFKLQYRLVTQTSHPLFAPHSTCSHVLRCLPGVSLPHKHLHPHLRIPTVRVPASCSALPPPSRPRIRPHSHSRVLRSARSPVLHTHFKALLSLNLATEVCSIKFKIFRMAWVYGERAYVQRGREVCISMEKRRGL